MEKQQKETEFDYIYKFFKKFQAAIGIDEYGDKTLFNNYYPNVFIHFHRDIIESAPFTRQEYDKHERLQEIITEFGLDKDAFWNLILYLYDHTADACKNLLVAQPSSQDILREFVKFVEDHEILSSITIEAPNKEKLTITDPLILKTLNFELDDSELTELDKFKFTLSYLREADKTDTRRKTSYFFAEQLAKFLGLEEFDKIRRRKGASVSNKEKELILSLLYVCKYMDNPESYLDAGYFNKLMKDYVGSKMNMSNKYELTLIPE